MADDPKQTGKPDDARINPDQEHELNYWSEKFGVSRDELRKARAGGRTHGEGRAAASRALGFAGQAHERNRLSCSA